MKHQAASSVAAPLGGGAAAKNSFTLDELIHHALEPEEVQWFAACRIDFLRSPPFLLIETLRLAVALSLAGSSVPLASGFAVATVLAMIAGGFFIARDRLLQPDDNPKRRLHQIGAIMAIRSLLWGCTINFLIFLPPQLQYSVLLFGVVMMVIDGFSALSLPMLAHYASIGTGLSMIVGLYRAGSPELSMLSVLLLTLMIFMHWAIYNFYYVYATRRIRTRRLSQSNETVQMLLNQYDSEGSDWLYQSDAAAQVQNPSPRFCKACGLLPEVLAGLPLTSLFRPGAQLDDLRTRLAKGIPFRGIVVPIEVADKERWFSLNGQPSRGSDGNVTGWRGFVADVTATREAEEQVKYLAHFDQLTRLPNRTQVRQCLERALSDANRGQIVGLLYIDLDHFKMVNDGHGHAMGDEVLREMARRLEAAVRPLDVVGRLGGDEFVVLLPHLHSPEQGMQIARRVQEKVGETMEIDGLVLPVGATMGLAMAPFDAQTAEDLLRAADVAMYDAKTRGRGSISIFDPAMQEELRVRRELETDLRLALEGGQLELHYQPIHGTIADRTVGYEALLRWEHPTRGMIQPDTFISIAEESGLIVEIGSWVLRTALAEAATWPEDMFVAVNLSPAQMRDSAIVGLVINALAASGVVPQRLELEITETMLIRDTERVLAILHQFRSLGVRIALDDFGTGYSSLNYLRSFPFDKIKIDRCFISELPFRSDCQAIIRSVRLLASELHMTTTAEGVETAEQLAILRENGIDLVQGYLISRPIPAAALPYATASPNRVAKGAVQPAIGERNSGTLARLSKPAAEGAANRPARRKGAARGS